MVYQKKQINQQDFSSPALINLYVVFIFIALSVFYLPNTIDGVQPVRLFSLSLFLILFGGFIWWKGLFIKIPFKLWNNPLVWSMAAFFVITLVSMIFALNVTETFFDIAKTIAIFAFVFFSSVFLTFVPDIFDKISKSVVISAFIAIGIGIYQYLTDVVGADADFLPDGIPIIYNVKGLMGHKNQYSANLMLMLPMIIFGIFSFRKAWRMVCIIATVLIVSMLFLIHTRAVWTAILLSGLVLVGFAGFYYKLFNLDLKKRNVMLISVIVVLVIGISAIIFIPANDPFSRFAQLKSIANPKAGNNEFRLKIWDVTLQMIADNPITGVGAGNWKIHSANYYEGKDFEKNQLNWTRPHNDPLWVFAEKGIMGIVLYIGIFLITLYYLFKTITTNAEFRIRLLAFLTGGGVIAYHISSLFDFPLERINQQIYLAFFTATAIVLYLKSKPSQPVKPVNNKLIFAILALLIFPVVYSSAIIRSDYWISQSRYSLNKSSWKSLLNEIKQSETWARNLDPESIPLGWYEGLAWSGINENEKALAAFQKAYMAHPTKLAVLNNLGIAYYKLDDYENAIKYFEKALAILPDYKESNEALASTYVKLNDYQKTLYALENIKPEDRIKVTTENMQAIKKIIFRKLIDEGVSQQKKGSNTEAFVKFDSAVSIFHSSDRMLQNLGSDYFASLDSLTYLEILRRVPATSRSEKYQNKIMLMKKEISISLNKKGDVCVRRGDYDSALYNFGQSLKAFPEKAETLRKLKDAANITRKYDYLLQVLEDIPETRRTNVIEEEIRNIRSKLASGKS